MSPGLMPRPSLSEERPGGSRRGGVSVSPGLMPRPSLSAEGGVAGQPFEQVSPGLMPRPSLSGGGGLGPVATRRGVSPGLMPRCPSYKFRPVQKSWSFRVMVLSS